MVLMWGGGDETTQCYGAESLEIYPHKSISENKILMAFSTNGAN